MKKIKLGSKYVGDDEPVYIIAEGGLTNWGEYNLAKKQVDSTSIAKADCIKFQAQTTEELVSAKVSKYWYDRLKYKELSHKELTKLYEYATSKKGIDCGITAHTDVDLEFLDKTLNLPFHKVGSGESLNEDFLKNVGSRKKPVVVSLGLHLTDAEIKRTVKILKDSGSKDIVALHCNTVYPTPPRMNDLMQIVRLKKLLPDCVIGYSDHTVGNHITYAAVALGAKVIEKHLSFDKTDERSLDCPCSCLPEELVELVHDIKEIEETLKDGRRIRKGEILKARKWARQSIVAHGLIKKGEKVKKSQLTLKRPGVGLFVEDISSIIGKVAKKDIEDDELILKKDFK